MPEAARKKSKQRTEEPNARLNKSGHHKKQDKKTVARIVNKQSDQLEETQAAEEELKTSESQDRGLPIENYDQLNVDQTAKQLNSLSPDQVQLVKRYEQEHKNRKTLLEQMDRVLSREEKAGASPKPDSLSPDQVQEAKSYEQEHKDRKNLPEQMDRVPSRVEKVGEPPPDQSMPIENYDQLNVDQVAKKLGSLSPDQMQQVKSYEQEHKNRRALLEQMEGELSKESGKEMPQSVLTINWNWILMGAGALVILWLMF
jgi:uncharacterized protein (DUF433 family)